MGGVARGIIKCSFQALTIAGKALNISQFIGLFLGIGTITNFSAVIVGYAMHIAGSNNESFNILKGISEEIGQTGKGVLFFLLQECLLVLDFGKSGKVLKTHFHLFYEELLTIYS